MKETSLAYHFVAATLRDGCPIPEDGVWLEHEGEILICRSGLHASEHPADALRHAPGSTLCYVEVEGIEAVHGDKLVARRRKIIRRIDATELLRAYARWCALQVVHHWNPAPVVLEYLATGSGTLRRAAASAAQGAMWSAERGAAWSVDGGNAAWHAAEASLVTTHTSAPAEGVARAAVWSVLKSEWVADSATWGMVQRMSSTLRAEFKRLVEEAFTL